MYKPGDVVNGHVLGHDNQWHPVTTPPPPPTGWPQSMGPAGASPIPPGPYAASGPGAATPPDVGGDVLSGSDGTAEPTQQVSVEATQAFPAPAQGAAPPYPPAQSYPPSAPQGTYPAPSAYPGQPGAPASPYGPGPVSPGGPVARPSSGSKAWIWIVAAVVVLLVVAGIAVAAIRGMTSGTTAGPAPVPPPTARPTSPAPAPTPGATAAPAPAPAPGGGPTVTDGDMRFTVKGVDCSKTQVGSGQILTKKADGKFCIVSLSITNLGKKVGYFTTFAQTGIDSKGNELDTDPVAEIYDSGDKPAVSGTIQPGATIDKEIIFDVASDATLVAVQLYGDIMSDGVKVNLG